MHITRLAQDHSKYQRLPKSCETVLSATGPLPKFFPGGLITRPENCYPWLPPPESSRTIDPTKPLASPKSIKVLSR